MTHQTEDTHERLVQRAQLTPRKATKELSEQNRSTGLLEMGGAGERERANFRNIPGISTVKSLLRNSEPWGFFSFSFFSVNYNVLTKGDLAEFLPD